LQQNDCSTMLLQQHPCTIPSAGRLDLHHRGPLLYMSQSCKLSPRSGLHCDCSRETALQVPLCSSNLDLAASGNLEGDDCASLPHE
tara:strand:+ start:1821 stop:2078 length:258 start_codon:yes stop_codon:yes gene_type:complete